jgi:hypothetical protein
MGHARIQENEILWWRHLSRRQTALVFPTLELHLSLERGVAGLECLWVNHQCRVLVCEDNDGTVEFAVLYESDFATLRRALG